MYLFQQDLRCTVKDQFSKQHIVLRKPVGILCAGEKGYECQLLVLIYKHAADGSGNAVIFHNNAFHQSGVWLMRYYFKAKKLDVRKGEKLKFLLQSQRFAWEQQPVKHKRGENSPFVNKHTLLNLVFRAAISRREIITDFYMIFGLKYLSVFKSLADFFIFLPV